MKIKHNTHIENLRAPLRWDSDSYIWLLVTLGHGYMINEQFLERHIKSVAMTTINFRVIQFTQEVILGTTATWHNSVREFLATELVCKQPTFQSRLLIIG